MRLRLCDAETAVGGKVQLRERVAGGNQIRTLPGCLRRLILSPAPIAAIIALEMVPARSSTARVLGPGQCLGVSRRGGTFSGSRAVGASVR